MRVLNPLPDELGGDVLASSDPELGRPHFENTDPRERSVGPILTEVTQATAATDMARLGIRWVAILHDADWQQFDRGLARDPGLDRRIASADLDLYRVTAWRGPIVTARGDVLHGRSIIRPLTRVPPSGAATLDAPAAAGWMRGWHAAGKTADGRIALPAGRGVVWFWPEILCAMSESVLISAIAVAFLSLRGSYSR
jgi:hypothetical protein